MQFQMLLSGMITPPFLFILKTSPTPCQIIFFCVLKGQCHKARKYKCGGCSSVEQSTSAWKKAETETHSESPINHFKAYVFSEIKRISQENYLVMYRTSGVIFFIDYCTAIRDTQKEGVEEKETSYRFLGHAQVAWGKRASQAKQAVVTLS
jgi:hypothetical protein